MTIIVRCKDGEGRISLSDSISIERAKLEFAHCYEYLELTATDNDLDIILADFHNIPRPKNDRNRFTWHGNMAKMILMNL